MSAYHPQNLLVTGGAGFIGSNFVHYWLRQYPTSRVVVLDALTYAGNRANLDDLAQHSGYRFIHGDINDTPLVETLLANEAIDTIVHFAAESHVDRSIWGPDAFIETNINGTHSLLKAARKIWLTGHRPHRFHHVSTDEVYGSLNPSDPPFKETTAYAPNSPYAASKAASDHLVRAYAHTYGLQISISNCSNNYGPYQFPEKLIPLCIINMLDHKPLPIYGNGTNVRDWLHVEDHCRGIGLCLTNGLPGETYNIGGGQEQDNLTLVGKLCDLMDQHQPTGAPHRDLITFVDDRPGHDRRYAIDESKIRETLGYQPEHSLERGLEQTVQWYLDHREWWRPILDGSYKEWIDQQYRTK